ncbi:MAG: hypothetical protein AAF183_05465 [Pseudomonadota bacterium]
MPTAILHIGTEKTGTSSLQAFFKENRAALNQRGFHYPSWPGHINHTGLAAFAAADAVRDDLRIDLGVDDAASLATLRERLAAEAAAETAAHAGRTHIFSNEHCSSRLTTPEEIGRLRSLLAPLFDRIEIAVYLRRQDQVAVSLYSTLLKFGGDRPEILPDPALRPDYWNYDKQLALWAKAFGRDAVHPRIFDRTSLAGGSVVHDFCHRWGLGTGYADVRDANESLQPHAGEVLRRLNTAFPGYVDGDLNRMRGELGARIGTLFPGRGPRPARAAAEAFLAHFAESNEAVRRQWFPDREALFSADFSSYPETEDARAVTFDQAIEVMEALWRETQTKEIGLRYQVAVRDGQIAELQGDTEAARAAYGRAIRIDPGRAAARKRLAGLEEATRKPAPPPPPEVPERWAKEDAQEDRRALWRKRLSLNGIRRLVGLQPRGRP